MAKKIFAIIGIVIGCGLLFIVGSALIMFLAPGTEIFGIRYVAVGQGNYELEKEKGVMAQFSGDVYIEATEAPINVSYAFVQNVRVEYKQNFIGFTKTPRRQAYIEFEIKDNDLHIKTYDIVKFIYSHQNPAGDGFYLNVYLPQSFSGRDVYIKSTSSTVNINGRGSSFHDVIDIDTAGDVVINNSLSANHLNIKTHKAFTLGTNVFANNIKIQAGSNDVKVLANVTGKLEVVAGNGSLHLGSVNELVYKSSSGAIKANDGASVVIGTATIETYSGSVSIDSITGSANSTIKTTLGNISINTAKNLTIDNSRGPVTIVEAETLAVNGGVGIVRVNNVKKSVSVTTRNGYVYLGSEEGGEILNPTVKTSTGKVFVKNAYGIVDIESANNSVELNAVSVTYVKISAGGYVNAYNLAGIINIYTNGTLDTTISQLSGNINVSTGDKCKTATLKFLNNTLNSFNYDLSSSKARIVHVYQGETVIKNSNSVEKRDPYLSGLYEVKVQTSYADIHVYTK